MASGGADIAAGGIREATIRILIVGERGVGKTCLVRYVAKGKFDPAVRSTLGLDFSTKAWVYEDHPCGPIRIKAEFTEIMGQDRKPYMPRVLARQKHGLIAVTALPVEETSLRETGCWIREAQQEVPDMKCLVVVNKSDSATTEELKNKERTIREYFLSSDGATKENRGFDPTRIIGFQYTSAKTGYNLPKAFTDFVEAISRELPAEEFNAAALPQYKFSTMNKKKQRRTCC